LAEAVPEEAAVEEPAVSAALESSGSAGVDAAVQRVTANAVNAGRT